MGTWHGIEMDNSQSTHSNIETVSNDLVKLGDSMMQVCK